MCKITHCVQNYTLCVKQYTVKLHTWCEILHSLSKNSSHLKIFTLTPLVALATNIRYEQEAPYDCIHVGAAAATLPHALVQQLKPGGKMIIPLGPEGGKQTLDRESHGEQSYKNKANGCQICTLVRKDVST